MQVVRIRREDSLDLPMNEPSLRTYSKLAKDVITALFWPREVKEALFLSTTAELGKGGGADQARMQLLGQQRTENKCML